MTEPLDPAPLDPARTPVRRATGTPRSASAAERQRTCAACGGTFGVGELTDVEVLLDGSVRYVAVHAGHSTFPRKAAGEAPKRAA